MGIGMINRTVEDDLEGKAEKLKKNVPLKGWYDQKQLIYLQSLIIVTMKALLCVYREDI